MTARYSVITGHGRFWVRDQRGDRVSGFFATRDAARVRLEELERKQTATERSRERPCMCCGTKFMSRGIHNRLCQNCSRRTDILGDEHRPHVQKGSRG